MPLSWNEIRSRALAFSKEWANESSEDAEAKAFWDAFFNVFGVTRRRVASFEEPVKKSDGKGVMLVEHKSRGKDLDRATTQAFDYFPGLKERDLPRYVVVSDFARFRLHDLDAGTQHDFDLGDLHKNVKLFGFMAGYQSRSFGKEAAVNIRAAEKPTFRSSFARHRCLIPASGFYEWQLVAGKKQPYYIHPAATGDLFAFAGILAAWKPPEGETVVSSCIITTGPNAVMAPIHDRMPVILQPEQFDAWLDPGNHDTAALKAMLVPCRPELMAAYPVSPAINSGRVEGAACIEPVELD